MNALVILALSLLFVTWVIFAILAQSSVGVWNYLEGGGYQPRSAIPLAPLEPIVKPEPVRPTVFRNFGQHHNPLSLSTAICSEDFGQINERTWQCQSCGLVLFDKPEVGPEVSPEEPAKS